ncbi:MAG TPA: cbb3-type cytochrome c oxidase N-terminal domain-containing protein [Anaeromyxobacter sp.]|nr:cbb3-type cytochrome c oxidase N-terminal domain-containing protein [Anaeromyxobacter sp.]
MSEPMDDLEQFEAKETSRKLPAGWLLLFWGLIAWGAWYLWTYSPWGAGWSQVQDLEGGGAGLGSNVFATVLFTAIPATAALLIVLSQRRKR